MVSIIEEVDYLKSLIKKDGISFDNSRRNAFIKTLQSGIFCRDDAELVKSTITGDYQVNYVQLYHFLKKDYYVIVIHFVGSCSCCLDQYFEDSESDDENTSISDMIRSISDMIRSNIERSIILKNKDLALRQFDIEVKKLPDL